MSNQNNRLPNYDLLRIISTISVVYIHSNYIFFGPIVNSPKITFVYISLSLTNIITRFSVPCFVMLSGAFLLQNDRNKIMKDFYMRSIKKIFIPAIIVLLMYIIIQILINIINYNKWYYGLGGVIRGDFCNLWYIYMLFGLYFLVPYIIHLKQSISFLSYKILSILMIVWAVISQMTSEQKLAYSIGIVFAFSGYLMLGDVLRTEIESGWHPKKTILIMLSIVLITITFFFRFFGYNYYVSKAYVSFFSPTIVLYSLCVFVFFADLKCNCCYTKVATTTFEVYLFHTMIMKGINRFFLNFNPVIGVCFLVISTLVISFPISLIFCKCYALIIKRIGNKDTLSLANKKN